MGVDRADSGSSLAQAVGSPGVSAPLDAAISGFAAVLRFVKIEHSVFALPFVYVGILAAPVAPSARVFLLATLAAVGARGAAMAANRIIDRRIDAANPRTADRELPAGRLAVGAAWGLLLGFLALFVAAAALLNPLCLLLAPVAVVPLVLYPYAKRATSLCHVVLGATLGIAPAGGFLAATGSFDGFPPALLLSFAVGTWVAGFDILYALLDVDVDRAQGIHSLPADWGVAPALRVSALLHVGTAVLLAAAGWTAGFGHAWFIGVAAVAGLLVTEHLVVRPQDPATIHTAFFTLNGLTSLTLLFFAVVARFGGGSA